MFYSSQRGRWIKRDANTANWINLPPLNRCDAWSLNAQMNKKEFQSLMMLLLFVHFFPSAWWRFPKIRRKEEERYHITRRRGGAARGVTCSVLQPPGMKWQAVVEHRDRIKRWVEHIKLISGHAENREGHTDTQTWQNPDVCAHVKAFTYMWPGAETFEWGGLRRGVFVKWVKMC